MNRHLDNDELRAIRANVEWRRLFEAMGIRKDDRKSRPDDWWGFSPFNPDEHTASFHMNDNGWYCHSSAQGGGPVELVQRLEGCSCYDAGRWLVEHGVSQLQCDTRDRARRTATGKLPNQQRVREADRGERQKRNQPVRQDLRPLLTTDHAAFRDRGILPEVLEELGAGYYEGCPRSRSPLRGRLVFQIRGLSVDADDNAQPVILSHIGRATTEEQEHATGKWLFYAGFHASLELYNQDKVALDPEARRQAAEGGRLILVEGCLDVAKLWSAGIRNTVASFGAHLSEEQAARLRLLSDRLGTDGVLVFFDRDQDGSEPNRQGAQRAVDLLQGTGLDAAEFDWGIQFRDRRRGAVGIPETITDPCEFTAEQLRWLRGKAIL